MMRVRITCIESEEDRKRRIASGRCGLIVGWNPQLHDCEVFLVDDDGTRHELAGVNAVSFSVDRENGVRATIGLYEAEIDVDVASAETRKESER